MKKALVVAGLIVLWIGSCGGSTEKDTVAVTHTILRYNQLLAKGYAEMNMTPLQEVAIEEQALKAYHHMSALGAGKIRMESELVDIEFLNVELPEEDRARVKTKETWNYRHIGMEMPSQTVVQGLIYELSYELVRKDGQWFVSSVTVLKEEKPEPEDVSRSPDASLE
jgi:hypothetical protein